MNKFASVNQFHAGTATGDAITNDMFEIQRVLRQAGFRSEIYAEHLANGLKGKIKRLGGYSGDRASLLIVHHSLGFDALEPVLALPDRKVLKYHNITPPELLPIGDLKNYAIKGRQQLAEYRDFIELALGDSDFNRRELVELGYRYTDVLPIFFRPTSLLSEKPDKSLARELDKTFNILFVGRICPNKKQLDLIRIFDSYRCGYDASARLFLVGSWEGCEDYAAELQEEILRRKLDGLVSLTGKVPVAQLVAYYRSSDLLLCASEHEGFCVPLLEAMSFDLPVIAYAAAAVPETLGDAGILLDSKEPGLWCQAIEEVRRNGEFRKAILEKQRKRLTEMSLERAESKLLEIVNGLSSGPPIRVTAPTVQIQGPFETSYSLAAVNRHLALALDEQEGLDTSIYCTEGPGDYTPKEADLADKPAASWLWKKSQMLSRPPDVVIRNLYPPRVHDVAGRLNLLYFAWEDSLLPPNWIHDFNQHLSAVLAPSQHVERVMRDSGLRLPIHVVGEGVDERFFQPRLKDGKRITFSFLHISSGFPRKGVDVLLNAYFTEFCAAEDVCLVIKTFPNVHNDVADQIAAWREKTPSPPRCIHLDRDLSADEIAGLYGEADCLVYPTRGEGFGLPIAEAMAQRVPVIVTAYSGHMDFCSSETALLLAYDLVPSKSHVPVPGAKWAEPKVEDLRRQMRRVYQNPADEQIKRMVDAAYRNIWENFRWPVVAQKISGIAASASARRATRVAMVTTWDARCGIAEYSRFLIEAALPRCRDLEIEVLCSPGEGAWDRKPVRSEVCWQQRPIIDLGTLRARLRGGHFDVVHFQFNFGFFDLDEFARTVRTLKQSGQRVFITFHATADLAEPDRVISLARIGDTLRLADALLVHNLADRQRLAGFGVQDNVVLLPHGNVVFPEEDPNLRRQWGITLEPVVGTFGFLLPHKGILELLEAVSLLRAEYPNIGLVGQCALHRDNISREFEPVVRERIRQLGLEAQVLLSTEFVSPEEASVLVQLADVLALPYSASGESISGAVRFALGTGRPVITTRSDIFRDVAESTFQIESNRPEEIAAAIRTILGDPGLAKELGRKARSQVEATSWERIAEQYVQLLLPGWSTGRPVAEVVVETVLP
jgi:glycosyltransferase involved in cell wall biosynthesis